MIAIIIIAIIILLIIALVFFLKEKYEPNLEEAVLIDGIWLILWYNSTADGYFWWCNNRKYKKLFKLRSYD